MRVALEVGAPEEKIVIPQAALISDQEGVYVFVASDGKAEVRRVKPAGESGTGIIIEEGLDRRRAGDRRGTTEPAPGCACPRDAATAGARQELGHVVGDFC